MVMSFMDKEELFGGGDSERDEFTAWLVISEESEVHPDVVKCQMPRRGHNEVCMKQASN